MNYSSPLQLRDLPDWISEASAQYRDIPSYRLAVSKTVSDDDAASLASVGLRARRRSESGVIEASRSSDTIGETLTRTTQIVLDVANREDQRGLHEEGTSV